MKPLTSLLGEEQPILLQRGGLLPGNLDQIEQFISSRYREKVIEHISLFEGLKARGFLVKTATRIVFCVTQNPGLYKSPLLVIWVIDELEGTSFDLAPQGENELRISEGKTILFDSNLFSSARLIKAIQGMLVKGTSSPSEKNASPQAVSLGSGQRESPDSEKVPNRSIFIVHGKDDSSKLELALRLRKLGLEPIILSEKPEKGRTVIEKFEQETSQASYAFIILTPDDAAVEGSLYERSKNENKVSKLNFRYRARQNVILELGYFVGKLGRKRVCCLYTGDLELPSDIHGIIYKEFRKSVTECYEGIINELKAAGYKIQL
jgi:predicted nucleotide-binding protein